VVAGSGVRCSAASGTPPGASGSPPGASGSPPGASGSPPGASGSPPLHARDLQLGSLVGLDFTPDGSLVLAEKLTAKQFRLLRIHSSGSVGVIHAGGDGQSGNKTASQTVVDIASMAVSPGGDVFIADNTQLKIFSLDMSNNGGSGQSSANNVTTVIDRAAGQSYQFNKDGLHLATRCMATGQLAYTFHYTTAAAAKGKMPPLARIEDPLGNQVTVIRDVVSSRVEAIQNALGITFPVKLNKQGRRKIIENFNTVRNCSHAQEIQ
jgi:hypothetical protein